MSELGFVDTFKGDNLILLANASALLELEAQIPLGISDYTRGIINALASRLEIALAALEEDKQRIDYFDLGC